MFGWLQLTLVVISIGTFLIFLLIFIQRRCCSSRHHKVLIRADTLQTGIAKLHDFDRENSTKKTNYYVSKRGVFPKSLFSWSDNPSLVTDAVENGWSRFGFATYNSSPSVRTAKSLLGVCAVGDHGREMEVEISWDVCLGSADFMQKIRLNPGLNHINSSDISVIRTALPLPGPPLGNSPFPQEAYFEITIFSPHENDLDHDLIGKEKKVKAEGEKTKLIQENSNSNSNSTANSESLIHVTSHSHGHGHGNKKLEELKLVVKDDDLSEGFVLSVGFTVGGSIPLRLPGSYPGSIGFNSDGSIYLDGIKLVFESEKEEWGRSNKVIGCGYNPIQRKVFFTVDSELVHEIQCKSEEFGTPLYPTLAASTDIMILVNFGQSVFKYAPANTQRTPNPCFIGPLANSPAISYEDSKELFSMGRIDAQWLNRSGTRNGYNNGGNIKGMDFDEESEGDLFEIVLERCGRSPNTVL